MIVLDSSAMLALLREEPGHELVAALLHDGEREISVLAHGINLCEVHYNIALEYSVAHADEALESLIDDGIVERNDMDSAFWRDVAFVIHTQRSAGFKLALGDACGLALARRVKGEFYTSDRAELQHLAAEICAVTFIR